MTETRTVCDTVVEAVVCFCPDIGEESNMKTNPHVVFEGPITL